MSTLNSSGKYDDLPYTNFPAEVDSWSDKMDLTSEQVSAANQYKQYCIDGNFAAAKALLNNNPTLQQMIIDAMDINQMRHALMAIERMWAEDIESYVINRTFDGEIMVAEYTHTYNASTKVHNFTGSGKNAKVLITAPYTDGDTFALNGTAVTAYMGGSTVTNMFNGQYMYFFVGTNGIYFIGGGDTKPLMPKAGGTFTGTVYFANGTTYYINESGGCKFGTGRFTGNVYFANGTTYYFDTNGNVKCNGLTAVGNITGDKVYGAVWNDYAEWFERGEDTEPGDIIALDTDCEVERYVKANTHYNRVVGVHSNEYSHIIGGKKYDSDEKYFSENIKEYIPVGLAGRVLVKVYGKVKKGQYIKVSDIPGVGIASDSKENSIGLVVDVDSGTEIHYARIKLNN